MTVLVVIGSIWLALALLALVACVIPDHVHARAECRRALRRTWRWR